MTSKCLRLPKCVSNLRPCLFIVQRRTFCTDCFMPQLYFGSYCAEGFCYRWLIGCSDGYSNSLRFMFSTSTDNKRSEKRCLFPFSIGIPRLWRLLGTCVRRFGGDGNILCIIIPFVVRIVGFVVRSKDFRVSTVRLAV